MSQYKTIALDISNKIASITLQRADLNVLNIEMMNEINRAIESLGNGADLKALVIKAAGKAFSAGVDVSEHTEEMVEKMISTFHRIFHLLDKMECPTISFVQGAALGGGCELACFCDMVVAAERVKFGQPEIKVGVFPPVATAMFPKYGFLKSVYELLLIGDTITAEQAIFPREKFDDNSKEFLNRLTNNSAVILRLTKKAIKAGLAKSFQDSISSAEQIYLNEMMTTKDAHEGLTAFLEKRSPKWLDK
ncbi:MAG: enoyl-CoA hydratase/isomerase family protein [Candidatus Zixiibacteriota bacterium]